ncbi:MAG: hypothetical protein UV74_C0001G0003 [Candidatus Woesebacteria bacterium GW2011_GWB1_43_14]|uniref:Uncharacterized protein n=1 Tax=Candidatus Woesebacteria bacterium GW2011_GWB1_43_14 TaxID=1618578 RepID=A0A0G1GJE7_9BACT|nr:MAG: hypothetical protein UV51_C0011G0002 [Candidatus Woesebacteria bacterium GW2011_GWC1_42_9]KKS98893.1 MAG: hypothetical protein UV74_C0001G0003 [Candidatus Woesebacteria bacterium GW2011_GWB1_43_14]
MRRILLILFFVALVAAGALSAIFYYSSQVNPSTPETTNPQDSKFPYSSSPIDSKLTMMLGVVETINTVSNPAIIINTDSTSSFLPNSKVFIPLKEFNIFTIQNDINQSEFHWSAKTVNELTSELKTGDTISVNYVNKKITTQKSSSYTEISETPDEIIFHQYTSSQ